MTMSDSRNQPSRFPSLNPSSEKSNSGRAISASTIPAVPTLFVRSRKSRKERAMVTIGESEIIGNIR